MEFGKNRNGLSNFVDHEINSLILDESFADISQEIFSKLSEKVSNYESENFDIYESISSLELNYDNQVTLLKQDDFKKDEYQLFVNQDSLVPINSSKIVIKEMNPAQKNAERSQNTDDSRVQEEESPQETIEMNIEPHNK